MQFSCTLCYARTHARTWARSDRTSALSGLLDGEAALPDSSLAALFAGARRPHARGCALKRRLSNAPRTAARGRSCNMQLNGGRSQ